MSSCLLNVCICYFFLEDNSLFFEIQTSLKANWLRFNVRVKITCRVMVRVELWGRIRVRVLLLVQPVTGSDRSCCLFYLGALWRRSTWSDRLGINFGFSVFRVFFDSLDYLRLDIPSVLTVLNCIMKYQQILSWIISEVKELNIIYMNTIRRIIWNQF